MSSPITTQLRVRGRRRWVRFTLAVLAGVFIGGVAVTFFSRVYNPFTDGIGTRSLLVMVPADADVVLHVPRVPESIGHVRDQGFVKALEDSRGFQTFLRTEFARKTGVVDALSQAFLRLDQLKANPPLGLELFGDISGQQLVFAGYAPTAPGESWNFIAAFRPESWLVLAGVNLLLDEYLGPRTVEPELLKQGVKRIERSRDSVALTLANRQTFHVARVRDVLVIGTRGADLARMKTQLERDGIPIQPVNRYAALARAGRGGADDTRVLARRTVADDQVGFSSNLGRLWGPENMSLLGAAVPRPGGEDLIVRLTVTGDCELALEMAEGDARRNDLASTYTPFTRAAAQEAFDAVAPLLPESTFAFIQVEPNVQRFFEALFQRREVFPPAEVSLIQDALAGIPEIKNLNGLVQKLEACVRGRISIGFFVQDRPEENKPVAGFAAIMPLKDAAGVRTLLHDLATRVRETAGATSPGGATRRGVEDIVITESGGVERFEVVVPSAVADPATIKVGFAIAAGQLLITNWAPAFREAEKRLARTAPSPIDNDALRRGLAHCPEDLRLAAIIDGTAIYKYLDQSVKPWAIAQTEATVERQIQWRAEAVAEGKARGLTEGTTEGNKFIDDAYDRRAENAVRTRRPEVEAVIRSYLDCFRGLLANVSIAISANGEGVAFTLRAEPVTHP